MDKPGTIRELLGLTQQELALVLNLSRTQVAKYELGTRDLPIASKYLLAELLQLVQSPELVAKNLPPLLQEDYKKKEQLLERLLKENDYQLELMARKINATEKRVTARIKALQVTAYLSQRQADQGPAIKAVLNSITRRVTRGLESEGSGTLFQYKLRYDMLVGENLQLQSELRKHLQKREAMETE
jgi:transcriptional regulator with XRE-family HTH domain